MAEKRWSKVHRLVLLLPALVRLLMAAPDARSPGCGWWSVTIRCGSPRSRMFCHGSQSPSHQRRRRCLNFVRNFPFRNFKAELPWTFLIFRPFCSQKAPVEKQEHEDFAKRSGQSLEALIFLKVLLIVARKCCRMWEAQEMLRTRPLQKRHPSQAAAFWVTVKLGKNCATQR